jgi:ubiquinone/menaquinone biosynthesis C-methylase UbiE
VIIPIARPAAARKAAAVDQLHPSAIVDPSGVRSVLLRALRDRARLSRGIGRRIEAEYAILESVGTDFIVLSVDNPDLDSGDFAFLSFGVAGESYFFTSEVRRRLPSSRVELLLPTAIHKGERRSRQRLQAENETFFLEVDGQQLREARLVDQSPEGIGVELPTELLPQILSSSVITFTGHGSERRTWGSIRNRTVGSRPDWVRLGLALSPTPTSEFLLEVEESIHPKSTRGRIARSLGLTKGLAQVAFDRALGRFYRRREVTSSRVTDIFDQAGRRIRALIDSWAPEGHSYTAVVIPPAWGRTKETLMPLAATLVASFRSSQQAIKVVRYDGINRRGESFRAAGCADVGHEHDHFTFSQGVDDLRSVIQYLHEQIEKPAATVIVSFSAASIEARRVVATDSRVSGWVCVVGSADLQSMMKSISGGIDYALGSERGVRFGMQEILGVVVDMDRAGSDALENELVYMSDTRRDMAKIGVPVTWIQGRHDAWMDNSKVRDALSVGDASRRKLVEVPTGHMLRTSRDALGVFELVAREVGAMGGAGSLIPVSPRLLDLERQRRAESQRLRRVDVHLKGFWEDYLLGKDRTVGIELMTFTRSYADFMRLQIESMCLLEGQCVVDLGSGTGALPMHLSRFGHGRVPGLVIEVDFVRGGLHRARSRVGSSVTCAFIEADVDVSSTRITSLPLREDTADAVLASLVLSYMSEPRLVLAEIRRILKPGGRLVISSLRRDADMSKLFMEGSQELRERWNSELAAWSVGVEFERATRGYMNEASRLLDLEEMGQFSFWDARELWDLLVEEGFKDVKVRSSFGDPPQAVIAVARL